MSASSGCRGEKRMLQQRLVKLGVVTTPIDFNGPSVVSAPFYSHAGWHRGEGSCKRNRVAQKKVTFICLHRFINIGVWRMGGGGGGQTVLRIVRVKLEIYFNPRFTPMCLLAVSCSMQKRTTWYMLWYTFTSLSFFLADASLKRVRDLFSCSRWHFAYNRLQWSRTKTQVLCFCCVLHAFWFFLLHNKLCISGC